MTAMSRHQLRAARALLLLRQEALAERAGVGVASIRRFENGTNIDLAVIAALRNAIEAEGAILVDPGTLVGGRRVGAGVTLRPTAELPAGTKGRLAALDLTPEQAAVGLAPGEASKVGRRTRIARDPLDKSRESWNVRKKGGSSKGEEPARGSFTEAKVDHDGRVGGRSSRKRLTGASE